MKKLCLFLSKELDEFYTIADLSNVFRNISHPSIEEEYVASWEYPLDKELEVGQLFYFTRDLSPGKMVIKVEPVDISEYESLLKGYRLFASGGNSLLYSNALKNRVLNLLERYYDRVVFRELRNNKLNDLLDGKN
jgi:hypothetical protein